MDRVTSGSDDSDTSSGDESSQPATELMITTRERRITAGNRYSQVVAQKEAEEDEEDDVALLFAEAEGEDEEYNSDEADDEADMSSSDDDDQGPDAGADDLEGEKEIQKQAKVERQKKRKADMALTTMNGIRKKPKIDPTSLHRAPDKPKPSKRKERVSWLPDSDAAPGRTSLRKQTVAHREVMLERLKENEELRLKNKAQREKKERLKQAEAPKELTQADRLAEAARNERRNAKSLNRWEAREKERAEEQAARLAALKNRKLEGPVLTSYSVAHIYEGFRVERESPGPVNTDDVPVRRKWQRKPKPPIIAQLPAGLLPESGSAQASPSSFPTVTPAEQPPTPIRTLNEAEKAKPQEPVSSKDGLLAGIHEYASMTSVPGPQNSQLNPPPHSRVQELTLQEPASSMSMGKPMGSQQGEMTTQNTAEPAGTVDSRTVTTDVENSTPLEDTPQPSKASSLGPDNLITAVESSNTPEIQKPDDGIGPDASYVRTSAAPDEMVTKPEDLPVAPAEMDKLSHTPKIEVLSTRNLVILERFDELSNNERRDFAALFSTKKVGKLPKVNTEYCAMTGQVAKYRDPLSDVGYANLSAYKKLKEAQKHDFRWSSMLGCYVGRVGHVARGVPEGFLGPA